MNNFLNVLTENKILLKIIASLAGAGVGYLIYKWIGCRSGSCPITSNPWMSMIWGALMGFILAS